MRDGQASMTARRVAAHRRSFHRVPCPWAGSTDGAAADQQLEADVADGLVVEPTPMTRYLQARTTFFDTVVVQSLDAGPGPDAGRDLGRSIDPGPGAGIVQAVSVGAGYDGRALRYARSGVRWFELDHPATQADKRARLDDLHIDTSGLTFVAADFAVDDVGAALGAAGHDPSQPTLFTCEGVAGYLDAGTLSALLAALGRVAASGSRLAITLPLETQSDEQRLRRQRLDAAVSSVGEPLASAVPRAELGHRLLAAGWVVLRAADPAGVPIEQSPRSSAFVVATAA